MVFMAFARVLQQILEISMLNSLVLILLYLLLGTLFNSFRNRIRVDFLLLVLFSGLLVFIFIKLHHNLGSLEDIKEAITASNLNYSIFPDFGSKAFSAFLVFIFVQWWAAEVIDMPGSTGQKLMSARNPQTIAKSIVFPQLFFVAFFILINLMPFFILLLDPESIHGLDKETAFLTIFTSAFKGGDIYLVILFFLIPFTALTFNIQNWSGALLTQNFYNYYVRPQASDIELNITGKLAMLLIGFLAFVFAYYNDSILEIIKYLLTITAGVGPVFILRWYWHRINAWVQLSAMVTSLIFPTLYDIFYANFDWFASLINHLMIALNLEFFPAKIIVLTVAVSLVWLLVMQVSPPTDTKIVRKFINTIKPGGIWNVSNNGKIQFWKRLFVAILLTLNYVLIFVVLWKIVNMKFWVSAMLLVGYVVVAIVAYQLLKKINLKHG
jgi:SSS family solute:Na+ symporter